jgi:tetratricopeptide (TPR) repeat protein
MTHINDYVKQNLLDTALDEAQYALQYAPNYLPVHIRMAEILLAQNRVDEALDKYKVVARLYEVLLSVIRLGAVGAGGLGGGGEAVRGRIGDTGTERLIAD